MQNNKIKLSRLALGLLLIQGCAGKKNAETNAKKIESYGSTYVALPAKPFALKNVTLLDGKGKK